MKNLLSLMKKKKAIIGMIHVQALPGTPKNELTMEKITTRALQEAQIYQKHGIDAIIIENMHDVPYLNREVGPEIIACMTAIATCIKKEISLPTGIQILAGANIEALAVAKAAGLEFIRAEGFVFSHIADEGKMDSDAGKLLRYRKQIGAEEVRVFTDIQKKHSSHAISSDVTITQHAETAEFFLSDGLIITGSATGKEPQLSDIKQVRKQTDLPILLGSGINTKNIEEYWDLADGFIIGSYFKEESYWKNKLSESKIKDLLNKANELKSK